MSTCAGAEREHRQKAIPSWPMEIFQNIDITFNSGMGVGQWAGSYVLFFPGAQILFCLGV